MCLRSRSPDPPGPTRQAVCLGLSSWRFPRGKQRLTPMHAVLKACDSLSILLEHSWVLAGPAATATPPSSRPPLAFLAVLNSACARDPPESATCKAPAHDTVVAGHFSCHIGHLQRASLEEEASFVGHNLTVQTKPWGAGSQLCEVEGRAAQQQAILHCSRRDEPPSYQSLYIYSHV